MLCLFIIVVDSQLSRDNPSVRPLARCAITNNNHDDDNDNEQQRQPW